MRLELSSDQLDQFNADYTIAQEIVSQNDIYSATMIDDDFNGIGEEFRDIVARGLYDQQTDTVFNLANSTNDDDYKDVAKAYNSLENRLSILAEQYESANTDIQQNQDMLRAIAAKSIGIAPNREAEITALLDKKLADSRYDRCREIIGLMAVHAERFDFAKQLFDAAARPWPVPLIPRPNEQNDTDDEQPEEPLFVTDEMPIDPELLDTQSENEKTVGRLIERYGHTNKASAKAAAFLMDSDGVIFTPLEIGRFIYDNTDHFDDVPQHEADRAMHMRILTLLNQYSGRVNDMLLSEGYFLQYGNRRQFSATGKQIGNTKRVYRAVRVVDGQQLPDAEFEDSNNVSDRHDIKLAISDMTQEKEATEQSVEAIEQEVSVTKEGRFQERLEHLRGDTHALLSWLDEKSILPGTTEQTITSAYLNARLMQLSRGKHGNIVDSVNLNVDSSSRAIKLDAYDIVHYSLKDAHKAVYKDFSRYEEILADIRKTVDEYYADKENDE